MEKLISVVGLVVLLGLAWLLSENKKKLDWRLIGGGLGLQIFLGVILIKTTPGQMFFSAARDFILKLVSFSDAGAAMVFGENFREHFFAFAVLSTIIFVSSVMSVLFYLGVIQKIVKGLAWVMVKIMNVSGAESLAASANVFVGQTEAPLVIKPYIQTMTRSELMCLMTGGMATVAGGVMAAFASFGMDPGHLLTASLMAAPVSLVVAKIILPETETSPTKGLVKVNIPGEGANVLDAACRGAGDGLKLALNVGAMLIAFVALAALINYFLGLFPDVAGAQLTVERVLGWVFAPLAYLIGVSPQDVWQVGGLLGKKMFLNEFVAYLELKDIKELITPRSFTISTYALCGFANFSSIAIQIGGIGSLVPERRKDLAKYGFKAMLGGTITSLITAAMASLLI